MSAVTDIRKASERSETLRSVLTRRERLSVPEAMELALRVSEELAERRHEGLPCSAVSPESIHFDTADVPHLTPPEQGVQEALPGEDVFGIGAIAYEMLAGIDPKAGGESVVDIREYNPSLQDEIANLVMAMLSTSADERPSGIADVVEALRRLKRAWWRDHAEAEPSDESEDADVFTPGSRFRGYVIKRLLGKGGLGAVYLAKHEMLDSLFALKILFPSVARKNPEYIRRFTREARLAARIRHPNVVAVHDAGLDEASGLHFMVMDYVTGSSLRLKLAFEGQLEIAESVRIVRSVALALSAGERFGLVHRDLKPENVMETSAGVIKLIDFGVAKTTDGIMDSLCTMAHTIFGTPNYVSPEQAVDSRDVDARSDIYSLGIMFYEALAGRRPFLAATPGEMLKQLLSNDSAPDVRTFRADVSEPLANLLSRMIAKRREDRPNRSSDIVCEIDQLGYGPDAGADTDAKTAFEEDLQQETSMADLLKLTGVSGAMDDTAGSKSRPWWRRLLHQSKS